MAKVIRRKKKDEALRKGRDKSSKQLLRAIRFRKYSLEPCF